MSTEKKKRGHIILLNGTSSSGKSTLSKAIIEEVPEYFHLSVDEYAYFIDLMETREDKRLIPVETSYFFHRNIAMFSDSGVNVIVDTVFDNESSKEDFWKTLEGYPLLSVGVECPEEELARREEARGDRRTGLAKEQLDHVHKGNRYDLTINTHNESTKDSVARIVNALKPAIA